MKEKENANVGMTDDPSLKESEPDMNEVKGFPSSSEANPSPDEIVEQRKWESEADKD